MFFFERIFSQRAWMYFFAFLKTLWYWWFFYIWAPAHRKIFSLLQCWYLTKLFLKGIARTVFHDSVILLYFPPLSEPKLDFTFRGIRIWFISEWWWTLGRITHQSCSYVQRKIIYPIPHWKYGLGPYVWVRAKRIIVEFLCITVRHVTLLIILGLYKC